MIGSRMKAAATLAGLVLASTPAPSAAACFDWPLRQNARGQYAYDGDTLYVTMPGLPDSIRQMSVRVAGIDTPEIRGQCPAERAYAVQARDYVATLLTDSIATGTPIRFCDPSWGRYGGRVVAYVAIGDQWLHDIMIHAHLARPYDGGKRASWCD